MPQVNDDGELRDEVASALRAMNWEERLAKARAQRSKALGRFSGRNPAKTALSVDDARSGDGNMASSDAQANRARGRPSVRFAAVVLLSMAAGAGGHWGATAFLDPASPSRLASVDAAPASLYPVRIAPLKAPLVLSILDSPSPVPPYPVRALARVGPTGDAVDRANRGRPDLWISSAAPAPWQPDADVLASWRPELHPAENETATARAEGGHIDLVEIGLFVPARVPESTASSAIDLLSGAQTQLVATARVGHSIRQTQVRYYHPSDAIAAGRTAADLGGIARDFTSTHRKPPPGRLEVYLAGKGAATGHQDQSRQVSKLETFLMRTFGQIGATLSATH